MSIQEILKKYWGYDTFRPLQEEIINAVLDKYDTLALMPTGGGKSICFQVPALVLDGICVVITPLIALMKDQVMQLQKRNIAAVAIYSGLSKKEIDMTLDDCVNGKYKFLYLSPERLKTHIFLERVKKMQIGLLAVDEAHCISQWGYDFRPPYLEIGNFRQLIGEVPVIALTATATSEVSNDIQDKLEFGILKRKFQKSFARINLSYSCFEIEDKYHKMLDILQKVKGSSIIYVRNRKKTKEIAEFLRKNGVSADFYHAGLSNQQRSMKQEAWLNDKIRVIVATNAFGMGIDKSNVRTVIHFNLPDTLEAYYQEAGRAGRDEEKAYAVLLYQKADIEGLSTQIEKSYPSLDEIRTVYQALGNFFKIAVNSGELSSYDFDFSTFVKNFQLDIQPTYYALKRLEEANLIQFNEAYYKGSKVWIKVDSRVLYEYQLKNQAIEPLIRVLLRLYEGLYTRFIDINENNIAHQLSTRPIEIIKALTFLHNNDILDYQKAKYNPQITFLTPRYDIQKLPLDIKVYDKRKERDLNKAKAIIDYIKDNRRCRTQILLEYFGELSFKKCGICDNCLSQKRLKLFYENYAFNKTQILDVLAFHSLDIKALAAKLPVLKDEELIDAVRDLLDRNKIEYLSNGKLSLVINER